MKQKGAAWLRGSAYWWKSVRGSLIISTTQEPDLFQPRIGQSASIKVSVIPPPTMSWSTRLNHFNWAAYDGHQKLFFFEGPAGVLPILGSASCTSCAHITHNSMGWGWVLLLTHKNILSSILSLKQAAYARRDLITQSTWSLLTTSFRLTSNY